MKPFQIFLFLFSVGVLSFLTMLYFPKEGVKLNDSFTLTFASLEDFEKEEEGIENVEEFLELYEISIDSTAIYDSIERAKLLYRKEMLKIQWPEGSEDPLRSLKDALEDVKKGKKKKLRVLHYGDSQIEGDRITSYIRADLQNKYGGNGPGLLPIVEGVPSAVIQQENSDNWHRFTLFGRRDTNILHNHYAPLGSLGMYTYPLDSTITDTTVSKAWVTFARNGMAKRKAREYSKLRLFYSEADSSSQVSIYDGDSLFITQRLISGEGFNEFNYRFDHTPKDLRVEFESSKSPEFYAFSLEGESGVIVDNIAMRGSSGTLFKKMASSHLKKFLIDEDVELFILQYGGNSVPYVKDSTQAQRYGRWFSSQLAYLKRIKPNATFILIGPSDMATKIGNQFVTYPHLLEVRDELKKAAFENGAGFWDLYEVMGGRNSMVSWVESDPPLAGADYVHFNHRGTKKVSELFLKAFWEEIEKLNTEVVNEVDSLQVME